MGCFSHELGLCFSHEYAERTITVNEEVRPHQRSKTEIDSSRGSTDARKAAEKVLHGTNEVPAISSHVSLMEDVNFQRHNNSNFRGELS